MQLNLSNPDQLRSFLALWHEERNRARTDLLWLCNEVLGYDLISERVHGPILDAMQKFLGAKEFHTTLEHYTKTLSGEVLWEPLCAMELLPVNPGNCATRQVLTLFPRGHAKSTLVTVAHSIQWILNYPNVRILITTATEELVTKFILEIRDHFIKNERLRFLFPELCPRSVEGKVPDLGNMGGFNIPGRNPENKKLGPGGKDATVSAATVGTARTGYHGDVFKTDDAVERLNSSTQNGIDEVIRHIGSMGDMLEAYVTPEGPRPGWHDVTGTPWDFSDAYQVIRNKEEELAAAGKEPKWTMVIRSAAPNWPDGPFLWPEKVGYNELKQIEDDPTKGPAQLSAQYLMNPIVLGQGLIDDIKNLWWMNRLEMGRRVQGVMLRGRLDLAGMDIKAKESNDFSCLTVAGFADGTLLVPFMRHGRPPVEEIVEWIFDVFKEYPQLVELTIEKASGASPLESWLRREMSARNIWLPVRFVPRTNQESKQNRIKGLRPWFEKKQIALSDGLGYKTAIEAEIKGFPKYRHDDFLDTLSDHMVDARGSVSGSVMTNARPEVTFTSDPDPISILLARAEMDTFTAASHDRDTGW